MSVYEPKEKNPLRKCLARYILQLTVVILGAWNQKSIKWNSFSSLSIFFLCMCNIYIYTHTHTHQKKKYIYIYTHRGRHIDVDTDILFQSIFLFYIITRHQIEFPVLYSKSLFICSMSCNNLWRKNKFWKRISVSTSISKLFCCTP